MLVRELLSKRSTDVITIRPEDTVQTTAQILAANNIGAMPVCDFEGNLIGVISERDLARSFTRPGSQPLRELKVADIMTRNVITCSPDDDVRDAMRQMSARHIRHLPVVEGGKLCCMLSSRDVLEAVMAELTLERNVLRDVAIASR